MHHSKRNTKELNIFYEKQPLTDWQMQAIFAF